MSGTSRDLIRWYATRLKCDAAGCDHQEDVPGITADLIGRRCPKCSASLLTQEDYEASVKLKETVAAINDFFGPVEIPGDHSGDDVPLVSFNPHAGDIIISMKDPFVKAP